MGADATAAGSQSQSRAEVFRLLDDLNKAVQEAKRIATDSDTELHQENPALRNALDVALDKMEDCQLAAPPAGWVKWWWTAGEEWWVRCLHSGNPHCLLLTGYVPCPDLPKNP
jgi:hypothetical protein